MGGTCLLPAAEDRPSSGAGWYAESASPLGLRAAAAAGQPLGVPALQVQPGYCLEANATPGGWCTREWFTVGSGEMSRGPLITTSNNRCGPRLRHPASSARLRLNAGSSSKAAPDCTPAACPGRSFQYYGYSLAADGSPVPGLGLASTSVRGYQGVNLTTGEECLLNTTSETTGCAPFQRVGAPWGSKRLIMPLQAAPSPQPPGGLVQFCNKRLEPNYNARLVAPARLAAQVAWTGCLESYTQLLECNITKGDNQVCVAAAPRQGWLGSPGATRLMASALPPTPPADFPLI